MCRNGNAVHAIHVETLRCFLHILEISHVSNYKEKHNAPYNNPQCHEEVCTSSTAKLAQAEEKNK